MNPRQLQRMVVRMLFDPTLVDRIYAGKAIDGLDDEARAQLTHADRRAWGTDQYRRSRALTGLIEEFPASSAQAGVGTLETFFSSSVFHRCIEDGGSMTEAFARWIAQRAGPVARIEQAMAQVRRPEPQYGKGLVLSPRVAMITVSSGTLNQFQAIRAQLGDHPLDRLVKREVQPVERPPLRGKEHLLVEANEAGEVKVNSANAGLAKLLDAASAPSPRERLIAVARDLGVSQAQAQQVVRELVNDGLLVNAEPPNADE